MDRVTILVDTREQLPLEFDPGRVTTIRRALPAGDYSLDGFERVVAVERKSLQDYVSSILRIAGRFGRELTLLSTYELGCVVVEGSLEDVIAHRYRSGVDPRSVFGATLAIVVDWRVPVFFCGDRQIAGRFIEGLLLRFHRKVRERCRKARPDSQGETEVGVGKPNVPPSPSAAE